MTKSEIEKALKNGLLIQGLINVKAAMLKGGLNKVIVSKNNTIIYNDIRLISINIPVELSEFTAKEQGMMCKKPYSISVLGIKEEKTSKKKRVKKK